jgi:hypothetical protein
MDIRIVLPYCLSSISITNTYIPTSVRTVLTMNKMRLKKHVNINILLLSNEKMKVVT